MSVYTSKKIFFLLRTYEYGTSDECEKVTEVILVGEN